MAERRQLFDDAVLPVALIRESALQHNIDTFASYCRRHQLEHAPHVKTTMSPEIFGRQRTAGAYAATVATVSQAETVRRWGAPRILLASQVTDRTSLRWLIRTTDENPATEVFCWLDSVEGLSLIGREHKRLNAERPVRVLIEVGHEGGRTGCRTRQEALDLAVAAAESQETALHGVAAFEGTVVAGPAAEDEVDQLVARAKDALEEMMSRRLFASVPAILTIGGSAYFDRVAAGLVDISKTEVSVVLRSGCYVTHDCGVYDELSPLGSHREDLLRPALEVWGAILSTPEPGLAIANLGRRDVSFDAGMPVITRVKRRIASGHADSYERDAQIVAASPVTMTALNDQHAYISDPESNLAVGDLIGTCISHPCTTFDKWRQLALVDDNYQQVGSVTTEF